MVPRLSWLHCIDKDHFVFLQSPSKIQKPKNWNFLFLKMNIFKSKERRLLRKPSFWNLPVHLQHPLCLYLEVALHILKDHVCATLSLDVSGLHPPPFVHREIIQVT